MTEPTPQSSVIIATRDRPHLLPRAVRSAQAAGTDVEVIVVDDASEEATARVCRELGGVRYVRVERNQRLGGARNIGLLASRAEFISFLDDDDLRLPGSLDAQVEVLRAAPGVGFVYGQAWLADQGGERTGEFYPDPCPRGDIFWELLERNFIPCPAPVFRKSCLLRVGMPSDALPGIEDWDLWIRIAELYPVEAVERPVVVYRQATPASGQLTSATAEMVALINRAYRGRWLKLPRAAKASAGKRRQALDRFSENMTDILLHHAGRALAAKYFRQARRNVATALRWHPLRVGRKIIDTSGARQFVGGALHERRRAARTKSELRRGPAGGDRI
ncbi:MAG: glycosyltransferase [Acidobacteriota bacterium]|nr:glycosyltransferase [Acidobacteriota bacterium]